LGKLQKMVQNNKLDMIIHNGDLAYNLDSKEGKVGDQFMRQIDVKYHLK
jgi:hypothetical protein